MALTNFEKVKILTYLNRNALGKMTFQEMSEFLNSRKKYSYSDFLGFFCDSLIKDLKAKKIVSLDLKFVECISAILDFAKEDNEEIPEAIVDKLTIIENVYQQFLDDMKEVNPLFLDAEFDGAIKILINKIRIHFQRVNEEVVRRQVEEIELLKKQVSDLQKKVEELLKNKTNLDKKINAQSKTINAKSQDISDLKVDNAVLLKENEELISLKALLNAHILELGETIEELENEIERLRNRLKELEYRSKENQEKLLIEKLQDEINQLRLELAERKSVIATYQEKEKKKFLRNQKMKSAGILNEEIRNILIELIYKGCSTIAMLIYQLNIMGIAISKRELRQYLEDIRKTVNIGIVDEDNFSDLEIEKLAVETNKVYDIPLVEGTRSLDVLLVSDFHITLIDDEIIRDFDLISEYCLKNNISIVINAGDFFSFKGYRKEERHIAVAAWQKLVETTIFRYPYNKNIINLVLGGNHDKDSVIGGIDAIKVLSSERTDFIYLGYTHAKVTFNGHVSALNSLGIHHPNIRYPNPVGDFSYSTEKLQSTINSMFAVNGEAWDTYLDVVGHIHKSGFDALKGICIVPSYTRDRVMDGAWHLKIYFDEKGNIMNMVLMPLVKKGGLVKITEMFYDKKLTKSI